MTVLLKQKQISKYHMLINNFVLNTDWQQTPTIGPITEHNNRVSKPDKELLV